MTGKEKKLKIAYLLYSGLTGLLFFLMTASCAEAQEQNSLLEATTININGEAWTFRTPPPPVSERSVLSTHPRLFLTQANLPEMRAKLADPVYAADMSQLEQEADNGHALSNALLYQIEGDVSRGNTAKNWLLAGNYGDVAGLEAAGDWVEPVLVFDWVFPLLSASEKSAAFNLLRENFNYDHRTAEPIDHTLYWNDVWARHPQLHYPILALAIAGDGIDDAWAEEVLDLAYDDSDGLVIGPYGPTKGAGFLDMLATVSLNDGGGTQAGSYGSLGTDYYTMYLHVFMPMAAWETATNQPMWERSPFFRKLPFYWVYERSKTPGNLGVAMPEIITGLYRDIEPDAAALARWMVDKWGRSSYVLVYRLILGDLRVTPKSPQDLSLPTSTYIRGADLFVSSRSWDEDALTVTAYSRYLDSNRFEPASGVFAIHRGHEEMLAVPSEPNKAGISEGYYSGLWVYDPNDITGTIFQKSTYWSSDRAFDAYTTASEPVYFRGGPDRIIMNNTYRGASMEYAQLLNAPGVRAARQTIVHLMDANRDFVVVYYYTDIPTTLKRAQSMRLAVPPDIHQNGYSIPGMNATIVAPVDYTITWVGGLNDELRTPPPEKIWYGNNRAGFVEGYSSDPDKAKRHGIGNLYVQPQNAPEQVEFLTVIEGSDLTPVTVTRLSDREAQFGGWQVSFDPNGDFSVTSTGGDNIPPTILNSAPAGSLPAGTGETEMTLETNENANCRYAATSGIAYDSMTNTFATTGGTQHSTQVSGLQEGQSYTYYARCEDAAGNANTSDHLISFSVDFPTSIDENEQIPDEYWLEQNFPNPFNPTTVVRYSLPETGFVFLAIYNARGQQVKTLVSERQSAGIKQVTWDGKTSNGETVTGGIYFITLRANGHYLTKKMTFLK